MTSGNLVDAALAALDLGETITIPSLPDQSEWEAYKATRRAMAPRLSQNAPAGRYAVQSSSTALN
jgi:hypothetical protein